MYPPLATPSALRQEAPGRGKEHDLGAVTFPRQLEIVEKQIAEAVSHGARVLAGLHAYRPANTRVAVSLEGGVNRPPMEATEESLALYRRAAALAQRGPPDVTAFAALFTRPEATALVWVHLLTLDLFQARCAFFALEVFFVAPCSALPPPDAPCLCLPPPPQVGVLGWR